MHKRPAKAGEYFEESERDYPPLADALHSELALAMRRVIASQRARIGSAGSL